MGRDLLLALKTSELAGNELIRNRNLEPRNRRKRTEKKSESICEYGRGIRMEGRETWAENDLLRMKTDLAVAAGKTTLNISKLK